MFPTDPLTLASVPILKGPLETRPSQDIDVLHFQIPCLRPEICKSLLANHERNGEKLGQEPRLQRSAEDVDVLRSPAQNQIRKSDSGESFEIVPMCRRSVLTIIF